MDALTPIFPLELVVYPGDELNLHIFEPRYRQLIGECSERKLPFGIPPVVNRNIGEFGTLVKIEEIIHVHPGGEMDIRTSGVKIFRIERVEKLCPGKLYSGARVNYPENNRYGDRAIMREVLAGVKRLHAMLGLRKKFRAADAELVSYDLAHHAGLSLGQEYELLALLDERERQEYLRRHLNKILPVVNEIEALKEKVKLNGHFKKLPGFELE
jgi:Lon protease-like protein